MEVATSTQKTHPAQLDDQAVSAAYIYLLGRLLITRQQQLDFQEGFKWNELVHRKPGGVDWPNPNLDVAYSEAWVAVDENSYLLVTVPKVSGRYYTVQFMNGWGETLANINERLFPDQPSGQYAVCLKGSKVDVPAGARRIDLPVKYSRVLMRVELGADWDEAVKLQQQFTFKGVSTPVLPAIPKTPIFDMEKLPGVEAFDAAADALESEPDINPGMEKVRAQVVAIAAAIKNPAERHRVDHIIRERAFPDFAKAGKMIGHGTIRNNWVRPKVCGAYEDDWLARTAVNFGGIWANILPEVLYFKGRMDSEGEALQSGSSYTLTFPREQLPARYANYFWSVIAVDSKHMRVLPNPLNRFLINNQSKLEYGQDGSLTLYFGAEKPADAPDGNWLPTPKGQDYTLTFRFYGPKDGVADGTYYPPSIKQITDARASAANASRTIAAVPGPVAGTRITEAYARMLAREAYFWAWPMANMYNKRLMFGKAPEPGLLGGVLPCAPLNRISMLTDYIDPAERAVACPNQDVVYGGGSLALDQSAVVVQVPDFGNRFWVYQTVDVRTDSFADLGAMYGTKPGFYLLVGPNWHGEVPKGITKVFRSTTNTGFFGPRAFQDDSAEDKRAIQDVISLIDAYPLAEFDGKVKKHDWSKLPHFPQPDEGGAETKWVFPETFFDQLPLLLDDATPLPGEEPRYAALRELLATAAKDSKLKAAMIDEATRADEELVKPLFQFRNYGIPLPHNWTTVNNGAAFGTDYFTRTAVGKSNILVNKPQETKYFYQDLDEAGQRLNSANRYTVTFAKDQLPQVKGFWSLTMYNEHHFFEPNAIKRYSVGTKNKDLQTAADGSLTIYVQAEEPTDPVERANWLPSPKDADFSLYVRAYWPDEVITSGKWTPPAVAKTR